MPSNGRSQEEKWKKDFGMAYTDRNILGNRELDALYRKNYGISRTELNQRFLADVPKNARILEVGCNVGNQLFLLREMGFKNLYGLELQEYALGYARTRLPDAGLVKGSAYSLPFKDESLDLVFTSGVLIHLPPDAIVDAMREILRCSRSFVWGFEYYADTHAEVSYRGERELLWKAPFARMYAQAVQGLRLVDELELKYLEGGNVDSMFLLRRN